MTIAIPDNGGPGPIPLPCHHGCSSRLQEQIVFAGRLAPRDPSTLDNGEVAIWLGAAAEAEKLIEGHHPAVDHRITDVVKAYTAAEQAVTALGRLVRRGQVAAARSRQRDVDGEYGDWTPDERMTAGRWARILVYTAVILMA